MNSEKITQELENLEDENFDPQAEFELANENVVDDLGIDHPEYYYANSEKCDCCHGFINKCSGQMCELLGVCHCFASESEENIYQTQKK